MLKTTKHDKFPVSGEYFVTGTVYLNTLYITNITLSGDILHNEYFYF